ncbi:MAG: riboflavin synthase [Acidiferrobacterales bacterium]
MFTGIVQATGSIARLEPKGMDLRMRIECSALDMSDVRIGDSISVNGVCLTALDCSAGGFSADVSGETLAHTTLDGARAGTRVNLEKALTPSSRLGGHLVSGHVDGVGVVRTRRDEGRSVRFGIEAPRALARYIAPKGSICVDGVSLTVNSVDAAGFDINIVPHTLEQTTLSALDIGLRINLEVDLIARYLERLLIERGVDPGTKLDEKFLEDHGFLDRSGR